jgi:Leucine-rich repeat (LRR) protein
MQRIKTILFNLVFCIQILLAFLLFFGDNVSLPVWLQVAGRLHPLILHLPIGLWILFFAMILMRNQNGLEHKTYDTIVFAILLFASVTASVTAFFGFLLSVGGDYGSDSLTTHKVSGIVLSWVCYLVMISYEKLKDRKIIFYGANSFALLALLFAGHTGATLTHGDNFVFEPLTENEENHLTLENSTVYQLSVHRVLKKKCFSCHNDSKAKGGLVMTSVEQFTKGGKHGTVFIPGKPDESNIIKSIELPLTDDHHMPPDGKAQLTSGEISLIRTWIESGADFEKKIADLKPTDSLRIMTFAMMANEETTKERIYPFQAASEDLIAKLNSPFLSLTPLSQNSPALRADFFVKESFTIKALENLKDVNHQLVELNLSRMPITDHQLSFVGQFKNLEKLNLNFTNVSSDLTALRSLTHLRSLSLSGTGVTEKSVAGILSLPELKELFIWNTKVSEQDQLTLSKHHPNVTIVWKTSYDNAPIKLSMPALVSEDVLKNNEPIMLKHPMPGVAIRYTLDGSDPDSINGEIFRGPVPINGTTRLKACAFKEGWLKSEIYDMTCFTEGFKPKAVNLLSKPDPQYPGEGAQSLMDGRKGHADLFKEPSWLGFRNNAFEAEFDFQTKLPTLQSITISYGKNTGGYIFPPAEVEVWGGSTREKVSLLKRVKVVQPTSNEPVKVDALIIPIPHSTFAYYKLVCKPVSKLPAWHSGKGDKGWFFVDEVFFN